MRRNCNLELRLVPSCDSLSPAESISPYLSMEKKGSPEEKQRQQLTIFYNGKLVVSDVTEPQARALILLASRVMEGKTKTPSSSSEPSSPLLQSQIYGSTGLPMKRSLQRFLQRRKNRIQATSPYHH